MRVWIAGLDGRLLTPFSPRLGSFVAGPNFKVKEIKFRSSLSRFVLFLVDSGLFFYCMPTMTDSLKNAC